MNRFHPDRFADEVFAWAPASRAKTLLEIRSIDTDTRSIQVDSESEALGDDALELLSKCTWVESVNLTMCRFFTRKGLLALTALPKLNTLNVGYCAQVGPAEFAVLCTLSGLVSLDICNCYEITEVESGPLDALGNLQRLKTLNLDAIYGLQDADLKALEECPALSACSLESCENISDSGIGYLCNLPNLRVLRLPGFADITNRGIELLAKSGQRLEILEIVKLEQIDDEGMRALARSKSLRSIVIDCCEGITRAGYEQLCNIPTLERVQIRGIRLPKSLSQHMAGHFKEFQLIRY